MQEILEPIQPDTGSHQLGKFISAHVLAYHRRRMNEQLLESDERTDAIITTEKDDLPLDPEKEMR